MRSFSLGLVSVLKSLLPMDVDVFLSGHADGLDKKAIEALITQIEQKQAKVKALVQEGKTLAEVKRAMAGADQPAGPGGRRWPSLVEIIYQELTVAPDGKILQDSGKNKETSVRVAPGVSYVLDDGEESHRQSPMRRSPTISTTVGPILVGLVSMHLAAGLAVQAQPAAAKDADDACRQVVSFAKLRRNRPSNKP